MATIKSYTDLSQSKKLAEILPIETADQTWERIAICGTNFNVPEGLQYRHNGDMLFSFYSGIGIPCWSLAALLSVLPKQTRLLKSATDATYHCACRKGNIDKWFDNSVDACYEMIIRLHELKLL